MCRISVRTALVFTPKVDIPFFSYFFPKNAFPNWGTLAIKSAFGLPEAGATAPAPPVSRPPAPGPAWARSQGPRARSRARARAKGQGQARGPSWPMFPNLEQLFFQKKYQQFWNVNFWAKNQSCSRRNSVHFGGFNSSWGPLFDSFVDF